MDLSNWYDYENAFRKRFHKYTENLGQSQRFDPENIKVDPNWILSIRNCFAILPGVDLEKRHLEFVMKEGRVAACSARHAGYDLPPGLVVS